MDEERSKRFDVFVETIKGGLLADAFNLTNGTLQEVESLVATVYRRVWESKLSFSSYGEARVWTYSVLAEESVRWQRQKERDEASKVRCPPAGGWLTVKEMSRLVGKSERWVVARLPDLPYRSQLRRHSCGHVFPHYPPIVVTGLQALLPTDQAAGDWLNLDTLAKETKRSRVWVLNRLHRLAQYGENRVNAAGRISLHWPDWTLPVLKGLATKYPNKDDWLSSWDMAKALNKDRSWVQARLDKRRDGEARRIPGSGKVFIHYPPQVLDQLMAEVGRYKPAGDWLTIGQLARGVGRSHNWVRLRVKGKRGQRRLARNGRLEVHYRPEVLTELLDCRDQDLRGHNRGTESPFLD